MLKKRLSKKDKILFAIRDSGKLGFMDVNGNIVIPARFQNPIEPNYYEGTVDFSDWVPVMHKSLWGFIDAAGTFKIEPKFELALPFSEDFAAVGEITRRSYGIPDGRWGYINRKGKIVIPFKFSEAGYFTNGQAVVLAPGKDGDLVRHGGFKVVDRTGSYVNNPEPGNCGDYIINENGEIKPAYDPRIIIKGITYMLNSSGQRYAITDDKGKIIFQSESLKSEYLKINKGYNYCSSHWFLVSEEGLLLDIKNGKCGFRDISGSVIADYVYDDACYFQEGFASVKVKKHWGFIDTKGNLVIEPRFEEPSSFSEGLAQAKLKIVQNISGKKKTITRYGFVNKKGEMVIEPRFTKADERAVEFDHGLAAVVLDKKRAYINLTGKIVWLEK